MRRESGRQLLFQTGNYCFQEQLKESYPQILGGNYGATSFECIHTNSERILLGGSSSSTDIVTNQFQAFASSYVLALSSNPQFGVYIFDYATGDLLKSLYVEDLSTNSIHYDFKPIDITSIDYYYIDKYYAFIGGSLNSNPFFIQFNFDANLIDAAIQYQNPQAAINADMPIISIEAVEYQSKSSIFSCAINLGPSQNDFGISFFQQSSGAFQMKKLYYFESTGSEYLQCIDMDISQSKLYVVWQSSITTYFGNVQIQPSNTQNHQFEEISMGSSTIVSKSYNYNVAYIMRNDLQDKDCINKASTTINFQVGIQTDFTSISTSKIYNPQFITNSITKTVLNNFILKNDQTIASSGLLSYNIAQLPNQCKSQQANQASVNYPSNIDSVYTYKIRDPQVTIDFNDFTYASSCIDIYWTYQFEVTPNTYSNQIFSFNSKPQNLGGGGTIIFYTDQISHIQTYVATIKGTVSGTFTYNKQFTVNVILGATNSPPYFASILPDFVQVQISQSLSYSFPSILDDQNDNVNIKIDSLFSNKQLPDFIKLSGKSIIISPSSKQTGTYFIKIILTDDNSLVGQMSQQYQLSIIAIDQKPTEDEPAVSVPAQNNTNSPSDNNSSTSSGQSSDSNKGTDFQFQIKGSSSQILTIKYSEKINLDYLKQFKIDKKALQIEFYGISEKNKLEEWQVVSSDNDQLQIKLIFTDNRFVSAYQIQDQIKVILLKQIFQSYFGGELMPLMQKEANLPTQILSDAHTPLFSIGYPGHVLIFIQALFSIINLDIFNVAKDLKNFFKLKAIDEYSEYNDRFAFLGYDNSNFIYLIGMPIFFLIIYLSCLYFIHEHSTPGDAFSFLFAIIFFGANIFLLLAVPILLIKKQKSHYGIQFVRFLNEIYKDLQTNFVSHYFYHSIFVLRRGSFALMVFYLQDWLYLQVLLFIFQNLLYMIYLIYGRPLTGGYGVEIFNELCTLLLSYFMMIYTDYVDDPVTKYQIGYIYIAVFIFNMFMNFLVILKRMILGLIQKVKQVLLILKVKRGLRYKFFMKTNESLKQFINEDDPNKQQMNQMLDRIFNKEIQNTQEFKSIFTPRVKRQQSIVPLFSLGKLKGSQMNNGETDDDNDDQIIIPSVRRKSVYIPSGSPENEHKISKRETNSILNDFLSLNNDDQMSKQDYQEDDLKSSIMQTSNAAEPTRRTSKNSLVQTNNNKNDYHSRFHNDVILETDEYFDDISELGKLTKINNLNQLNRDKYKSEKINLQDENFNNEFNQYQKQKTTRRNNFVKAVTRTNLRSKSIYHKANQEQSRIDQLYQDSIGPQTTRQQKNRMNN
ncbi:UNKNOWN [Stylonychia lemnae]|uniref:Cadg domain containing protein n=1 Tax=Stylonychia lemnae TaxID=5949 RepID=A0A078B5A6_STYLE|nr:UNKNOWN [Stylonychia lemnae]|eukprot:CDW89609.1 UNKNOWN [Stylonychia lemnae]